MNLAESNFSTRKVLYYLGVKKKKYVFHINKNLLQECVPTKKKPSSHTFGLLFMLKLIINFIKKIKVS